MNSSQETPSPREPGAGETGAPASSNRMGRRWRNLSRENRIGAGLIGAWAIVVAAVMTQAPGGTPTADVSPRPGVNAATRADSPFSLRDGGQASVAVSGSPTTATGIKDGGAVAAPIRGEDQPARSAAVAPAAAPFAPAASALSVPQIGTPQPAPAPPVPPAPSESQTSSAKLAPAPAPKPAAPVAPAPKPAAPVAPAPKPAAPVAPVRTPTPAPKPTSTGGATTQPDRTSAPSTSGQSTGNSRWSRQRDSGASRYNNHKNDQGWNKSYGDRGSNRGYADRGWNEGNHRGNRSAWSRDGWGH